MNDWKIIIKAELKAKKITQYDLTRVLGVSTRSAVGHYLSGRRRLSIEQAKSLCAYLGLSFSDTFSTPELSSSISAVSEKTADYLPVTPSADFIEVPFYKTELSAGHGAEGTDHPPIGYALSKEKIERIGITQTQATVARVIGESMESTLMNGDVILISTTIKTPISNKLFAFEFDGELKVKRFVKRLDGSWRIISDNPDKNIYPDEALAPHNADSLRIIGQVALLLERNLL